MSGNCDLHADEVLSVKGKWYPY